MYRMFIESGGFRLPTIDESMEREYRQRPPPPAKTCPHGKTMLTCTECYFSDGWGKK